MVYEGLTGTFWRHVTRNRNGCLVWHGDRKKGYGVVHRGGRKLLAHRVAWEAVAGPIPEGMVINHLCRNRACVRSTHLEVTTHWGNIHAEGSLALAKRHGERTHCPQGHRYDADNTVWFIQHNTKQGSIGR